MNFQMRKIAAAVAVSTLGATASMNTVLAAEEGGMMLEEVVVTAQKRAESAQDIPIAVSAFSNDFLKEANIVGADKLVFYTPGLNGNSGQDTESVFTVRGIGTAAFGVGADNSIGMFIDDVPIGRPTLIGGAFFDLERVEVVKGPQGTLFGRNASAGAISLITNKPYLEENSLEFTVGAGNEGQRVFEAYGNLAVNDKFALRAAGRHEERDGTFQNTVTGDELNNRDHTNVRLGALYEASDTLTAFFSAEAVTIDTLNGFTDVNDAFVDKVAHNDRPSQDIESYRYLMKLTWDINDVMTLTSNTSYLDYELIAVSVDADVSPDFVAHISEPQEGNQFVQEFRLNGGSDNMDWFVGASFIQEEIDSHYTLEYSDFILTQILVDDFSFCDTSGLVCQEFVAENNFAATENTSYAVYGDVAWAISDLLKLTVGARYTSDKKDFELNQPLAGSALNAALGDTLVKKATNGLIQDDDTWTSFDPRIALDYQLAEDILGYASVSFGYKSGGFNSDPDHLLSENVAQKPGSFDEETVIAYEIGVKSRFWDGRAQVNASVYFNDYEDFQVETGELVILIENAANVETKGFEIDGTFLLTENFTLMANYSYLDAEFTEGVIEGVDVSGQRMARAPENSGAIIASYGIPLGDLGELTLRGDYVYTDEVVFDVTAPDATQDDFGLFNARISFESASGNWGIAVSGENLGDEEYFVHRTAPLGPELAAPAMGALYRVELTARF